MPAKETKGSSFIDGRARARADQIELIRKEDGGPRLPRDEPAARETSRAKSGAAGAAIAAGVVARAFRKAARTTSRISPTADSTRALSHCSADAAMSATGSWPSVPHRSRSGADMRLAPATRASAGSWTATGPRWRLNRIAIRLTYAGSEAERTRRP